MGTIKYIPRLNLSEEIGEKLDGIVEELVRGNIRLANKLISLALSSGVSNELIELAKEKADAIAKNNLLQSLKHLY